MEIDLDAGVLGAIGEPQNGSVPAFSGDQTAHHCLFGSSTDFGPY